MEFRNFVTKRLEAFRDRPRMYSGDDASLEMLAIQLMELEVLHYEPESLVRTPRLIIHFYSKEVTRRYGFRNDLLAGRYERKELQDPPFSLCLFEVCQKVRAELPIRQVMDT